jgi:hypothetical protein
MKNKQYIHLQEVHTATLGDHKFESNAIMAEVQYEKGKGAVLVFYGVSLDHEGNPTIALMISPQMEIVLENMARANAKKIEAFNFRLTSSIANRTDLWQHVEEFAAKYGMKIISA